MFAVESGGVLRRSTQMLSHRTALPRIIDAASAPALAPSSSLRNLHHPHPPGAGPSVSEARENFREDRANAITLVTDRVQRQHDSVFCLGFWQNELPSA